MGRWTLEALAGDLREGKTTSRELVEQALARISDPAGEGAAFISVDTGVRGLQQIIRISCGGKTANHRNSLHPISVKPF